MVKYSVTLEPHLVSKIIGFLNNEEYSIDQVDTDEDTGRRNKVVVYLGAFGSLKLTIEEVVK